MASRCLYHAPSIYLLPLLLLKSKEEQKKRKIDSGSIWLVLFEIICHTCIQVDYYTFFFLMFFFSSHTKICIDLIAYRQELPWHMDYMLCVVWRQERWCMSKSFYEPQVRRRTKRLFVVFVLAHFIIDFSRFVSR